MRGSEEWIRRGGFVRGWVRFLEEYLIFVASKAILTTHLLNAQIQKNRSKCLVFAISAENVQLSFSSEDLLEARWLFGFLYVSVRNFNHMNTPKTIVGPIYFKFPDQ